MGRFDAIPWCLLVLLVLFIGTNAAPHNLISSAENGHEHRSGESELGSTDNDDTDNSPTYGYDRNGSSDGEYDTENYPLDVGKEDNGNGTTIDGLDSNATQGNSGQQLPCRNHQSANSWIIAKVLTTTNLKLINATEHLQSAISEAFSSVSGELPEIVMQATSELEEPFTEVHENEVYIYQVTSLLHQYMRNKYERELIRESEFQATEDTTSEEINLEGIAEELLDAYQILDNSTRKLEKAFGKFFHVVIENVPEDDLKKLMEKDKLKSALAKLESAFWEMTRTKREVSELIAKFDEAVKPKTVKEGENNSQQEIS